MSNIVGEIPPLEYFLPVEEGIPTVILKSTIQLNFGSTNAFEIKLNPEEHQDYAWVSKEDLGRYNIIQEMIGVVKNALEWAEQNLEGSILM